MASVRTFFWCCHVPRKSFFTCFAVDASSSMMAKDNTPLEVPKWAELGFAATDDPLDTDGLL